MFHLVLFGVVLSLVYRTPNRKNKKENTNKKKDSWKSHNTTKAADLIRRQEVSGDFHSVIITRNK